jgi:K+-transporting ATPase ATPase A chain
VALVEPVKGPDGNMVTEQTIPVGPVASQEAIKELGTNGGGFFNANSAHPFENPTPLSNFLEMLAILLIPTSLTYTFGKMVGDTRQGWAVLAAMVIMFLGLFTLCYLSERAGTPQLAAAGADITPSATQSGGNMEGKEVRFDARFVHAARRNGADVADPVRRGGFRRHGLGPVRHAHLRHCGGFHRRPDGR